MTTTEGPGRRRPFADVLREMARGRAHEEATTELATLVERVQDTGKKGTLTITINVAQGGEGQIVVDHKVATKLPEFSRPATIFYADDEHNLVRDDPRQGELFSTIRAVDSDDAARAAR